MHRQCVHAWFQGCRYYNSVSKSPLMSVLTNGGGSTHRCPSPITTCLTGVNPFPEMLTAPSLGLAIVGLELLLKHFMNRFDL